MLKRRSVFGCCFALVPVFFMLSGCLRRAPDVCEKADNIVLMIGDGMGIAHIQALMVTAGNSTCMERLPVTGLQKTSSANRLVTDSGAAATALACGVKTRNGFVGTDSTGHPVKSLLEIAEEKGLKTGMVVTCAITHATPAAFYAHVADRNLYEDIALDFLRSGVDFCVGGGRKHFMRRGDGLDLLDSLDALGYKVVSRLEDVDPGYPGMIAGLTADMHMQSAHNGRDDVLPRAVDKALDHLSRSSGGFFLVVEGSQIDWAGHRNNTEYLNAEMKDFDRAVGVVLQYAKDHPRTLVIVTSDHETGGMSVNGGDLSNGRVEAAYTTDGHSAEMVPVFAAGPGAMHFTGVYENTGIFRKIEEMMIK